MLIDYVLGQTSVVLRVKIRQANSNGLTGLTSTSTGLRIGTIVDNEASSTAYTVAGSTIESITTLGTYAAPTATKCRFKELDATNHPGIYEIQIADARFAVSNAKSLLVTISGATNMMECDAAIPLRGVNPYDAVRMGMTALPNVASGNAGAVVTAGTGTAQLSVSGGVAQADVAKIAGSTTAATNAKNFWSGVISDTGTAQTGSTSTTIKLQASANANDNWYNNATITIFTGTGAVQTRQITAYNGTTKVATVDTAWVTTPDNTSQYQILGRIV